jgi:hypothetical protein
MDRNVYVATETVSSLKVKSARNMQRRHWRDVRVIVLPIPILGIEGSGQRYVSAALPTMKRSGTH